MSGAGGGLVPGSRADFSAAPATARLFETTAKDLRVQVAKDAEKQAEDIVDRLKKNLPLEQDQIARFGDVVAISGRHDLVEKVVPDLKAADVRTALPEGTSATVLHAQIEAARRHRACRISNAARSKSWMTTSARIMRNYTSSR
jgi:hypothetical protein